MSEEQQYDVFDQLGDTSLADVETTMPLLSAGMHQFTVKSIERTPWKNGNGSHLTIQLSLAEEAVDVTNKRVCNVGYPVIDRISLVKKGQYDPMVNIARFLEALGMKDQPFDKTFESYLGAELTAITKITPEQTNPDTGDIYPPKVEVSRYVKA